MKYYLRRIIKIIISYILVYTGLAFIYYYFKIKSNKEKFRILVYHRINDYSDSKNPFSRSMNVAVKDFEKQLKFLRKFFNVAPFDEIILNCEHLLSKSLCITFDDGYKDNYDNAFPLLRKYNLPATIFITTKFINTEKLFWWDEIENIVENNDFQDVRKFISDELKLKLSLYKNSFYIQLTNSLSCLENDIKYNLINKLKQKFISPSSSRYRNLTWHNILEMNSSGIKFGSHTSTHAILSQVDVIQLKSEVQDSKNTIENKIGERISGFAYPGGSKQDVNDKVIELVRTSGYDFAVTNINGLNNISDNFFKLKRVPINGDENFAVFICRCFNIF